MEINLVVKSFHCFINLKRGLEYMMMTMLNSKICCSRFVFFAQKKTIIKVFKFMFGASFTSNLFAYFIIPRHKVINNSNRTNFEHRSFLLFFEKEKKEKRKEKKNQTVLKSEQNDFSLHTLIINNSSSHLFTGLCMLKMHL